MAASIAENGDLKQPTAIAEAAGKAHGPSWEAAETQERNLVQIANSSGAAAYQFNPDASPEEKAAVAAEQVPAGFRHPQNHKAVAVVSDADDGAADNKDLPPISSLPDIGREGEVNDVAGTINGAITEDMRFSRERTGWAPQFVTETSADDEGTLLDHQTFLEGKLDDKFYGDWYHNAGIIIFACVGSWVVATLGGGLAWVIIVMAFCSTYYRTSIRRVRRNFRDDMNREMAKQRLETDTESLEWINSFLVKFWPIYAPVISDTVINSVDQVLSTSTPAFLDSLRLKTFTLGSKPPRLEHVKTYPKTDPDTVIMDWKFSFTPNDTADLTARQLKDKINPKVVLQVRIGKGVLSKGLDVIVEDMACTGLMRMKVKLQVPFPHVERIDVCFLQPPEIDYVCKPLGGDTLGFDINIIPGIESFIKDQIHGNLRPMMYDPNVFPVEIAKMLAGNPIDTAIGVVAVTLHGARQIKNTDQFSGIPDPYAVVSLNDRAELGRTKTITGSADPVWGDTIYVIINSFADALSIHVFDYNEFRKDKDLGAASFALDKLETEPEHESLHLEVMASGRSRGAIHADIRFFPVLKGRTLESGEMEAPPEMNTGIARFTVEQAKELDSSMSMVGQLNPYGVLLLNGKEIHKTKKLKRTNNPVFQDASKEFLITNRKTARLGLLIKDDRDFSSHPVVGSYQIKLNDMMKMMERGHDWFHLQQTKSGRVKMTLEWKPVAIGAISGSAGYLEPIGVMRIHVKGATDLKNVEAMGKSDPYTRALVNGLEKRRTVTFRNNLEPQWDEVFYVPIHSVREQIVLEVMDEESIGSDRTLGSLPRIAASDYIRQDENGEHEVDDEKQLISGSLRIGRSAKGYLNHTIAFYPTIPVIDPEEQEKEEKAQPATEDTLVQGDSQVTASESKEVNSEATADVNDTEPQAKHNKRPSSVGSEAALANLTETSKIFISAEDLSKYNCGIFVFKLHSCALARAGAQIEVLMDDNLFPAYVSPKIRGKSAAVEDVGEAFIRELDFSRVTLRVVSESNPKSENKDNVLAELTGETLPTLQRILYNPTELTLRSSEGETSKITVSARFIPVRMQLDPRESFNNMGSLRVDVLDAADLPSADRNGYSDPYCKFRLAGETVFKTKVQKKTLHPAWNEFFETSIISRIGADFMVDVYDWDFGEKADHLGSTKISLEQLEPFQAEEVSLPLDGKSGAIRLKLLFKPNYVMRTRQGSSTFSGTFATPGKIVGAPVKGVGIVGGNVLKGASLLKHGIGSLVHRDNESTSALDNDASPENSEVPRIQTENGTDHGHHSRNRSTASQVSEKRVAGGSIAGKGDVGTAIISIVSASDYPPSANVRVIVKLLGSKGAKEIHKTKAVKSSGGPVHFDASHETCRVPNTTADAQYQIRVVHHSTFGSDDLLGEALFFVDDQGTAIGQQKPVKVGNGVVSIRSSFTADSRSQLRPMTPLDNSDAASVQGSPDSRKLGRRSFLSRRSASGT